MKLSEKKVAGGYLETTYILPRPEARKIARKYFDRFPKGGYDTCVSSWHVTTDGKIHFTMRRLPTCD